MIARAVLGLVRQRLRQFPAVALLGPRQCGKTTLARSLGGTYHDLEQPGDRVRLDLGWDALADGNDLVVLDEAQAWPDIFPRLRAAIDAQRNRHGRFLLTDSVSPTLMRQVGESLAGRLGLVEMSPLLLGELDAARADRLWRMGGFPDGGVLGGSAYPAWHESYLRLMAERDLPNWGLPARPAVIERLLRMLAAQQGAILNASKLGQSMGLSHHTVQSYLDYLQGAFAVRHLAPYAANLRKRLVKAPRIYLRDSGLLHCLLGMAANADLWSQPWVGASWEGWVIEQILADRVARGQSLQPSYFRTHDGLEADLVLESNGRLEIVEIKLTTSPSPEDFSQLDKVAKLLGATRQVLISRSRAQVVTKDRWSVSVEEYLKRSRAARRN